MFTHVLRNVLLFLVLLYWYLFQEIAKCVLQYSSGRPNWLGVTSLLKTIAAVSPIIFFQAMRIL